MNQASNNSHIIMSPEYTNRVYAGVLGKLIGVYLGSPVEGQTYEHILREVGEIWYYLQGRKNHLLVRPDDDITGTFTFLRALADHGHPKTLNSEQIGQTWLNYIIYQRSILWWGGLGNSTEHTAYLRLRDGVPAPLSGSMALNGKLISEQIGAQIFIDGWAMVSPGDPDRAAYFAEQAARVSHDGEAVYAAQLLAAMESQAFIEPDRQALLDCGLSFIPKDSIIFRLIQDLRQWHQNEPDWRKARQKVAAQYGYDRYGGNCHVVPNHALIILGFLYGDDDFQKSLMIVNTCGWDTDCNSGNLGCLMGIKNGLPGIDMGPDWRSPVADRLYLPSADGGRAISDAATETVAIVNMARKMNQLEAVHPKAGARFHFSLPGSVQGFRVDESQGIKGTLNLRNTNFRGENMLGMYFNGLARGVSARAATPTFIPPETLHLHSSYELMASPTLYPGQHVTAHLFADTQNPHTVAAQLYLRHYGAADQLLRTDGPAVELQPGTEQYLSWTIPDLPGSPIFEIGIELASPLATTGVVYLDYLTWSGSPTTKFVGLAGGKLWQRAWVNGLDHFYPINHFSPSEVEGYRIVQDSGTGLAIQGCRDWQDYTLTAQMSILMSRAAGIAVRVQGLRRYYALLLLPDMRAQLVKVNHLTTVLAEVPFQWEPACNYELKLHIDGSKLSAWIDGRLVATACDPTNELDGGGIGLAVTEGCATFTQVSITATDA